MTYLWKHAHNKDVPLQEVRLGNKFHTRQSLKLKRSKKKEKAAPQAVMFSGHGTLTQGPNVGQINGLTQVFFMTLMKSLCSEAGLESRSQDEWRADSLFPPSNAVRSPDITDSRLPSSLSSIYPAQYITVSFRQSAEGFGLGGLRLSKMVNIISENI